MDPQTFPILMPLFNNIDELCKIFAKGNAKHQAKACALRAEPQAVDDKSDIGELKTARDVLVKEVEMRRDDWLKAMESFYTIQECLLTLCHMASPSGLNQTQPQNGQGAFGLPALLIEMKEELVQRIAEEKAARLAGIGCQITDKISDVEALKSENSALTTKLEALNDGWLNMSAGFFAFVNNLVDIGLVAAPSGGLYPSQK